MTNRTLLAIVMAGGEGKRLHPLTAERSKPAVPFGGRYRIVDFVLSNMINSGVYSIYLLVQYKSQSLIEHIRKAWSGAPISPSHFVTVVPPQMRAGTEWFQGTADAVFQSLNLIYIHRPSMVAVFGADHIYRMDVTQMVQFHEARSAGVTVAALPVPIGKGSAFGIVHADADGRIREFLEKPAQPPPMPGDTEHCYASMGNYLFETEVLVDALHRGHQQGCTDFGKDILPMLLADQRVFAYDFATNRVPGVKPYEEQHYWRDVGTIEAYYEAHQDMLGLEPRFDEFNIGWPIYSEKYLGPIAKIISGRIDNSVIGSGSLINNAIIRNSVVGHEVIVKEEAIIEDSIILDYSVVGAGSRINKAIVDRFNILDPNTSIGYDRAADQHRYHVSPEGIVVVPVGYRGLKLVY